MTDLRRQKIYFLGELGIFVQFALGVVERYLQKNPSAQIDVLTFPDYGKLLVHLFPENISYTPYEGPSLASHRFGIGLIGRYPAEIDQLVAGRRDITGLAREVGITHPLYFARQNVPNEAVLAGAMRRLRAVLYSRLMKRSGPFFPIVPISKPISVPTTGNRQSNVMLLPRFRNVAGGRDRNLEADFWNALISDHLAPQYGADLPIYVCGLPSERVSQLDADGIATPQGDLLDEIGLLNETALLICPLSGYGQLASFAGADVLYVLPPDPVAQVDRHIAGLSQSNIFDRKVAFIDQDELLSRPDLVASWIDASLAAKEDGTP